MSKVEIGQLVWVEVYSHSFNKPSGIREARVEKVGRKWFEVEGIHRYSFSVETGCQKPTEYIDAFRVWFSKDEILAHFEANRLRRELKEALSVQHKWPIEKVKAVLEILQS